MADLIKVLSQEQAVNTTPNTISSATLVRVFNKSNTENYLVTVRNSSNTVLGTLTLGYIGNEESVIYLMKSASDTIEANNNSNVLGVSVGYY